MRKILILLCAVAFLGLTLSAPYAEAQDVAGSEGYNVRRAATAMKVAQYANNAMVNNLIFRRTASDDPDIADAPAGETLTIKVGYGLLVTNEDSVREKATAKFTLWCDNNDNALATDGDGYEADCEATATATDGDDNIDTPKATFSNEGGTGIITITIGTAPQSFVVAGVRVDASGLELKDEISASVSSTTDATSVGLGGGSSDAGVSGVVGVVSDGLKVTAAKDADLACSAATPAPSITVGEGYTMAWGPTRINLDEVGGAADAPGADMQTAGVKIYLDNLPDDAKVEWPGTVNSYINIAASGADEDNRVNGTLTMDSAESSSNGKVVVYNYARVEMTASGETDQAGTPEDESMMAFTVAQNGAARSFKITPSKTTFKGDASVDVSAALYPDARRGTDGEKLNLDSELSFEHPLEAPEKGNGDGWLVISECVTYLLYPFITCGAVPGWSTGISVSNTTADANVFGAFDATSEQDGGVVLYGFPKDRMLSEVEDEDEVATVEAVVDTISDDLKAGETMTFDCGNTMMAGMEGYAIIRAGFQHARGMAFVLGNFPDGAGVDVSHGYMAEVINDPGTRSDELAE